MTARAERGIATRNGVRIRTRLFSGERGIATSNGVRIRTRLFSGGAGHSNEKRSSNSNSISIREGPVGETRWRDPLARPVGETPRAVHDRVTPSRSPKPEAPYFTKNRV